MRLLFLTFVFATAAGLLRAEVDFNRDVQPILSEYCYHCHGPDAQTREAKLRLDVKEGADGAFRTEDGVTAIKPGDSKASELVARIFTTDEDDVMPPKKSKRTLSQAQKETLKRWIEEGAKWGQHWAFTAPKRPAVPGISDFQLRIAGLRKRDAKLADELEGKLPALAKWPKNAIDAFVLARQLDEGLTPSPEAEPEKLCRRLYLDLTGLPPTPAEVDEFLRACGDGDAAKQDAAVTALVGKLLASPRYGERMVWEWLEAARYADTNGYQGDPVRAMWYWRDWAIKALNDNMRFDQFTIEQIAGDLLPEPTQEQLVATGFHRNHMINGEGGRIPEESRVEYVQDRVETTATVWLGLTFTCCRCHDHKYDPLKQSEYYSLSAYFNSVDETGGNDSNGLSNPILNLVAPEQHKKIEALRVEEDKAKAASDALEKTLLEAQPAWEAALAKNTAKVGEPEWQIIKVEDAISENGATLTKQADGSVLVSGKNPDNDELVVTALTRMTKVSALKIEVLPDDSLPNKASGRAQDGGWILSEIQMLGDGKPISLATVRADFEQSGTSLQNVLDERKDTGWSVGPEFGKKHEAVFELQSDFGYRTDKLVSFRLQFHSKEKQRVMGRFRISLTDSPAALLRPIPPEVYAALAVASSERNDNQRKKLTDYYLASEPSLIMARKKAAAAKSERKAVEGTAARTMVMRDRATPRDTFILVKGAYDKFGDRVTHGTPAVLPALPPDAPKNRLSLARWLVSPENPLTARVTVNRYWQMFFGRGLVKTAEDFGVQGEKPTHPELLDWLAREFIESGWDVKHIHRLIVTSATYRQQSKVPPGMSERDPENQLLARGPRFRLQSWMLRDQALAASGLFVEKLGGAPVKVYQPSGVWEDATFGQIKYAQDHGDALYRRSLYIFWRRIIGPTLFFDVASRQNCVVKTSRTNTPLHALVTLNDVTYVEAARSLGERMLKQNATDDAARLAYGFQLCTARMPSKREAQMLAGALARFREQYRSDTAAAEKLIRAGESKPDATLAAPELAAHTSLALLLLNLDETLTKE
jgi:hypothetical protein